VLVSGKPLSDPPSLSTGWHYTRFALTVKLKFEFILVWFEPL